jgi:hypothetical protein
VNDGALSLLSWHHPGDTSLMLYGALPLLVGVLALVLARAPLPARGANRISYRTILRWPPRRCGS